MVCIGILIILFSLVLIRRRYSQNNIRLSAYHCILTLSGILIAFGLWFGWIVLAAYCPLTVYVMEKDAITKVRKYMKIHPKRTRLLAAVMAIALVIDIPMGINKIILNGKKQEYTELLEQKITEAYSDEVCVQYGLQSISCKVTDIHKDPLNEYCMTVELDCKTSGNIDACWTLTNALEYYVPGIRYHAELSDGHEVTLYNCYDSTYYGEEMLTIIINGKVVVAPKATSYNKTDSHKKDNTNVCSFCHRTFTDSANKKSIRRTGMCKQCFENYKYGMAMQGKDEFGNPLN
jgi:hypothetical protein